MSESWNITLTHTPGGPDGDWTAEIDLPGEGVIRCGSAKSGPMAAIHPLTWAVIDHLRAREG